MRDVILAAVLLWLMIKAMRQPWIGIMGWTWVSVMNPHSFSWALHTLPVAAAMAGSTFIGILASKEKLNYFATSETTVLMLFMLWMCITLPFSFFFDKSFDLWVRVMKIDFMILVALAVLYSRRHIMALTWVLAGSLGFYGVKGGIFTLATGGSYRVWGPSGSYIDGNNEVALALVMTIPLIRFLQLNTPGKWMHRGLSAAMLLCAASALGSQSRGALVAIAAMALLMWWRGNKKFQMGLIFVVLGVALITFMPDTWTERMSTIKTYDQDSSAGGRINAWWMAFNLATHNFFGGGFMVSTSSLFALYAPDPLDVHAAHSIYFMVLGEHGFVGLFLFLLLWFFVWRSAGRLYRDGRKKPETQWMSDLGAMCQVSLVGYLVGGAFLSLSYYDLPYNILILVVLTCRLMDGKVKDTAPATPALTASLA
ncbi:putative O-glycosylation ligase, exosortase A system-associated [Roseateles koreensis]|uniref:O-glycosylation ligase, exosortase A system-associated n=1 Tax=Roseateles koreensis TaxID=2987526 RepID=A0ABT5KTA5_9BURK|nr:putative O-glycosylation ligase, exosortase A system-associated [Roseateles koreensis]MDC8786168.1 putative O-glycosylation ligase, exosortase A system-associated [Roseateles koreensis]